MSTAQVAVIGCGYWGKNLVRNFVELNALEAVVDPIPATAAALAGQFNVKALSLEAALADPAIGGVAIAAPAELHADLAVKAFAAGKHVFVEKPIALTVADAVTVIAVTTVVVIFIVIVGRVVFVMNIVIVVVTVKKALYLSLS